VAGTRRQIWTQIDAWEVSFGQEQDGIMGSLYFENGIATIACNG